MSYSGIKREWSFRKGDLTPDQLAFCRRWVKERNEAVAVVGALISFGFHVLSWLTDPHVADARFISTLSAIHALVVGSLLGFVVIARIVRIELRHVLHTVNFAAVCTYIYILYECLATGMPKEDVMLASVAVSLLSVFAILLSPCGVPLSGVTALAFWGLASLAYGMDPGGLRWVVVNALGLTSAVAFQAGRIVLANKEGLREHERLRQLGLKARGEATKRKKVEIQLAETQERAQRAEEMAFLTEMTGGIAHEIDNPLSALQLRASTMEERALRESIPPEEIVEFASRVAAAATRIGRIVKGIRSIGRRAADDDFETEQLQTIVDDVVEICQGRLKTSAIELRLRPLPDDIHLRCRAAELGQVLLNLVSNAADAVDGLSSRWIELAVSTGADNVVITVTDSGRGVPPDMRERIFEPFFTTKGRGRGTGLGLGIVKAIVERHGGTIGIDDKCRNTRFVVRLPRECAPTREEAA